jgi:hypothetical protein
MSFNPHTVLSMFYISLKLNIKIEKNKTVCFQQFISKNLRKLLNFQCYYVNI